MPRRLSVVTALIAALVILPVAPLALAQPPGGPFTLEDFLTIPTLGSIAVSPDGQQVAWTRSHRDLAADRRRTELWLAGPDELPARRLTWQDEGAGGLAWRPDGSLSFRRPVDGTPQVWINPLDGSEPRPVTDFAEGVGAFWWSPDGAWIAVLAPAEEDTTADVTAAEAERADWVVRDRLEDPATYPQLWLVPAGAQTTPGDDRIARRLSDPPVYAHHVAWSPDGATLAVTYNPRFSSLVDEEQRVALVDVASGQWTDISDPDRHASLAAFSPSGRHVAFYTDREDAYRAYLNLKDLVAYDRRDGQTVVLTAGTQLTLGGTGSTPHHAPVWSADGETIFLDASRGTTCDLYRLGVDDRELVPETTLAGNLAGWSVAGGTLAYVESALHRPGTLYARPVDGDRRRPLDSVDAAVEPFGLQPPRKLQLPGHDGVTVEGFLFLPPGAGARDRLPGVIEMHGGPYHRYGNAWTTRYPWHVLAHQGFAVFIANPRGGTGYGEDFLRGVHRNFGTDDYRDLMAAVDALVERGTLDADRLGFTGYSYGGLMTNVVVSRTDRFRCAVSIAGIWNYPSAMGQNNPQLFIDSYEQPWAGDLERMWEHSPASRAAAITTPTLLMHGLQDEPVDPRQSVEMFSYLQLNGVPSRLVLYPEEGHGIDRPSHMLDYQSRELEWFRHYLLDDPDAQGAEPAVPVEPAAR
jgi:dipeptidyl aminopeptidase/acylaminoacyl peptidase